MRGFANLIALGFAVGILAACSGGELSKARNIDAKGTAFTKNLYSEYIKLAEAEFAEGDYLDSDSFALRAKAAAAGEAVGPEPVSARVLPDEAMKDISGARSRLVKALAAGAREKMPAEAARAQAMYDCWIQEQEENFQSADIDRCRAGFQSALATIEMDAGRSKFVVYFDLNSTSVTARSRKEIAKAVDMAKQIGATQIYLIGHTDRAGDEKYNRHLSIRRVRSVAARLKTGGLGLKTIRLDALGETKPAVETADGVTERRNRRVEIVVVK